MSHSDAREPRLELLLAASLFLIGAVYVNALQVGFMWDDHMLIVENTELHHLEPPWMYLQRSFWQHPFFYGNGNAFFRPLVTFSFALDWAAGSGSPVLFHLTNVVLHLLVCTLLFFMVKRFSGSGKTAAVATAVFGVMPRLTESVTWIPGRTDVLATLFVLAALLAAHGARSRWAVGALLWCGLLAKEVAMVGCAIIAGEAALTALRTRALNRQTTGALLQVTGAVVGWAILRRSTSQAPVVLQDVSTFLAGFGQHTVMLLSPWNPQAQVGSMLAPPAWAAPVGALALASVAIAAVVLFRFRADRSLLLLLGATLAIVAVTVVRLSVYTLASDRFLYLPWALLLGMLATRPWPSWALGVGVSGALALTPLVVARNDLWANPLKFWFETQAAADPRNPGALSCLGDVLSEVSRYEEALPFYDEAVRLTSTQTHASARLSRAVVLSKLGKDHDALEALTALIQATPDWKRARYDMVLFRARAGDLPGASQALIENRARYGDDEVLRSFDALLEHEATVARDGSGIDRARALAKLGASRKAEIAYLELVADPEAGAEAAQWLVAFGSRPSAAQALETLSGLAGAQALFDERFNP
jgi:protein O-mannosyl-transferase